ncbi:uncharacterized protein LOC113317083 [Papaver somniferum]|uniref:uncharacterized protein LOC113317083 n=1 Tax=Papaver somniferum TaxID=3469 RepID=UPI000E702A5B|nr:uncharacterized protein LOC113317083 [Papaver somniferum]
MKTIEQKRGGRKPATGAVTEEQRNKEGRVAEISWEVCDRNLRRRGGGRIGILEHKKKRRHRGFGTLVWRPAIGVNNWPKGHKPSGEVNIPRIVSTTFQKILILD